MQAWLADLPAFAYASRMEPTFRSRMQMQVQEVTGLALTTSGILWGRMCWLKKLGGVLFGQQDFAFITPNCRSLKAPHGILHRSGLIGKRHVAFGSILVDLCWSCLSLTVTYEVVCVSWRNWEVSYLVNKCESQRFSFQVSYIVGVELQKWCAVELNNSVSLIYHTCLSDYVWLHGDMG